MVEVSAAKRNITPPFPMYMRGYAMRTGKSIGVLDELYCRTLVLRINGEIFIWTFHAVVCHTYFAGFLCQ